MKTVGIIAEYNPFHNGHQYHIEEAKRITGADRVVVVMSGDYVQRGEAAIMSKHMRAQMAIENGASCVFELPVCYSTGSAEYFALGAIAILESFHCIDAICFGSECNDMNAMKSIAQIMLCEPEEYKKCLKNELKSGKSFPVARSIAISKYSHNPKIDQIMKQPNNILGIEYLKALDKLSSSICPYTIQRIGNDYHSDSLNDGFASASAIREQFKNISTNTTDLLFNGLIENQVPKACNALMENEWMKSFPVYTNTLSLILKYILMTEKNFEQYQDVSKDLSNRIINKINDYINFDQFCDLLKSKEITYARISRALLHIMLHITKQDTEHYLNNGIVYYAHLLGFRKNDSDILTRIKKSSSIPILTKLTDTSMLDENALKMLNSDCFASNLYQSAISETYHTPYKNELQKQIIRA